MDDPITVFVKVIDSPLLNSPISPLLEPTKRLLFVGNVTAVAWLSKRRPVIGSARVVGPIWPPFIPLASIGVQVCENPAAGKPIESRKNTASEPMLAFDGFLTPTLPMIFRSKTISYHTTLPFTDSNIGARTPIRMKVYAAVPISKVSKKSQLITPFRRAKIHYRSIVRLAEQQKRERLCGSVLLECTLATET